MDLKPRVINYQVNDICNARCVMCNIWQRQRATELTPGSFRSLLSDPFFCEVQHLGITGGEPTLRADLGEFYEVALDVLPKLQGGHFITNGFSSSRALDIFGKVHAVYSSRNVSFGGMVSIDGVGPVHNRVRGRTSAFERATETLFALQDAGIPVIACCTIVRENVYGLHDLLDWALQHGIEMRFRVAEFIDRLYVDQSSPQIRAFDVREIKHLVAFFHRLIHFYEQSEEIRRTYQSIISLLIGGSRLTGCPYQTAQALSIDCEGRFSHCAPHGSPHSLGSTPALDIARHEPERSKLMEQHCDQCIHDYHANWSAKEANLRTLNTAAHERLYGAIADFDRVESPSCREWFGPAPHILLVGWYGTETAGDIAILGGIAGKYERMYPGARFTLFSLFPSYTAVTVKDLPAGLASKITVIDYSSVAAESVVDSADAIVMAGGPLMDIPQTGMIASLFKRFRERSVPRIIDTCGIGPLNDVRYRNNVTAIALMATEISVRDNDSAQRLREYGVQKPIEVRPDPACDYVRGLNVLWQESGSEVIRCFLRELTAEYPQDVTPEHATAITIDFLRKLLVAYPSARIELLPMHYFPVGNDDRIFARQIAGVIGDARISAVMEPLSPEEIIQRMASSKFCVSMRFHSVVFAHTIGAPYIAIDYTAGGKIAGFLRDTGEEKRCFGFEELESIDVKTIKSIICGEEDVVL